MSYFGKNSHFDQTFQPNTRLPEPSESARLEQTQKTARSPLEHWHHDLETVGILLDQDPPEVDRAKRLIEDLRREVYLELR